MKILVVAATTLEMDFMSSIQSSEKNQVFKKVLGVGQVPTTYHLLQHIENIMPELIVQTGIAGSFLNDIALGEVFVIEREFMADLGVQENGSFQSVFDLKLMDKNQTPFSDGQLKNPHEILIHKTNLKKASSITVNEISTSLERINEFKKQFNPTIESMEGAAFHYCCLMKNIPFVQIRGVSNYVGERDKSRWHIETALQAATKSTQDFISNI